MRNSLRISLVFSFLLSVVFLSTLWADSRQPRSYSEPLSCFEQGPQLICFDGDPVGVWTCRSLKPDMILCSRS